MPLIDSYLPRFQFSETHSCRITADASAILQAVAAYKPENDRFFRAMIGLREVPARLLGRRGSEPFGMRNFTLLERTERALVYGLIGQFWQANYGLRKIADGPAFKAFGKAGVPRLALGFEIVSEAEGIHRLTTQTRVFCPDDFSRRKFRPYWLLIRPVSGLIRRRILASIRKAAEAT
jgi:hypothetical protein